MGKQYHVHVYQVDALAEIDVFALNDRDARQKVYDKLEENKEQFEFKKPDTEYIIIEFER